MKSICSPKRTKFLDEFIKPKDLIILDIGAGWGQLTIPLAKQNQICSLEPTPTPTRFYKNCIRTIKCIEKYILYWCRLPRYFESSIINST